jgi:Type I phosphodiesterase / nucleotide pyrophosphatase
MKMLKVALVELNELNFEAVHFYIGRGYLHTFKQLLDRHGYIETTSETMYEELEPWIQWVTAHTGLTLKEHGVFRLGDIVNYDIPQIWEQLEQLGYSVGAISPMNAKNRVQNSPFFMPDPWTQTPISGPWLLSRLHKAIGQVVGDNAKSKITFRSALWLVLGLLRYARPRNYLRYLSLVTESRTKPWAKPMILDLFLTDLFVRLCLSSRVNFASLFLNASAHIQHHYMFNSPAYTSAEKNPDWYIAADADPLLEIYSLYDRVLAQLMEAMPNTKLLIATGLHQDPHPAVTYYWRLKNHSAYLNKIGIAPVTVEPLMSRDFIVRFDGEDAAARAADKLISAKDDRGIPLFDVDNRSKDLFVMLTYPNNISEDMRYTVENVQYASLKDDVAFVAIKNGQHNGIGYLIDPVLTRQESNGQKMELKAMPELIRKHLAVASGAIDNRLGLAQLPSQLNN